MKVVVEHAPQATDESAVFAVVRQRADAALNRPRRSGVRVEQLLTVAEAAECVGCCEETIRRAYLARQLNVLRFGARRVRIRPCALTAWLERGGKTAAV